MATYLPGGLLETVPRDKDLLKIAQLVGGRNWEMLAPHLITGNSNILVNHITMDHSTCVMKIYNLLIIWRQQAGSKATFRELLEQMLKVSPFVYVDWKSIIAEYLNITERETLTHVEARDGPVSSERVQNRSEPNLTNADGPSLETKLEKKTSRAPRDACLFDGRLLKLEDTDIKRLETQCTYFIGKGGFGEVYTSKDSLDGFGMRVAVKICKGDDPSVRRERFASRIMHPFILPLLAVVDK